MAIRTKYFLQVHPLVFSEDLANLPMVLQVLTSKNRCGRIQENKNGKRFIS